MLWSFTLRIVLSHSLTQNTKKLDTWLQPSITNGSKFSFPNDMVCSFILNCDVVPRPRKLTGRRSVTSVGLEQARTMKKKHQKMKQVTLRQVSQIYPICSRNSVAATYLRNCNSLNVDEHPHQTTAYLLLLSGGSNRILQETI